MMLLIAFKDCELGIPVRFRSDGSVLNLRRLQARTKTSAAVIRDLLYTDECAFLAHSDADAQQLFDRFYTAASRFGLTVSLQQRNRSYFISPSITAGDVKLPVVDKFCYLGSIHTSCIDKASSAFGRLRHCLWGDHGIRLDNKISAYVAVVLTILLYGCREGCIATK